MTFLTLFALGTVGFYILLGLTIFFLLGAMEHRKSGSNATFVLIVALSLFFFLGGRHDLINGVNFVIDNPSVIIPIIIGYLILGIGWSFFKWYLLLIKAKQNADERYISEIKYLKNRSKINGDGYEKELKSIKDACYGERSRPFASHHKGDIIAWMSWWPVSLTWFIINDPVRRSLNYIYNNLAGTFDKMGKRIFGDIPVDVQQLEKD